LGRIREGDRSGIKSKNHMCDENRLDGVMEICRASVSQERGESNWKVEEEG